MQSADTGNLSEALAKAQAEMKAATFNKTNPHFKNKYADLAAVLDAIRKPLAANGLSVTQTTEIRDGGFVLVTTLRHTSGQWVASEYPLPVAAKPQELGSALTYARRYSLSAIACIAADDDDDAEGAREGGQTSSAPKPKSPVRPQPVAPPVHPETGEVSPHLITASSEMEWGQMFVAAVQTARSNAEIDMWVYVNATNLNSLESMAPRIHKRVMDRVAEVRAALKQKEAA